MSHIRLTHLLLDYNWKRKNYKTTVFVARSTYHRGTNVAQWVAVSVCEPWTKVTVVILHYYPTSEATSSNVCLRY